MLMLTVTVYLSWGVAVTLLHPAFLYPFSPRDYLLPDYTQTSAPVPDATPVPVMLAEGNSDKPAVLFFMGNFGSIGIFAPWLEQHRAEGRTIAAMEFRGGGGNPGRPSETRLKADALAAHDWLAERSGRPVVLHGYSLGTGLALHVAARRKVAGVVLEAPYARLCALIADATGLPACLMPVQRWDSLADVPNISAPVLILHGLQDQVIPPSAGTELASALRANAKQVDFVSLPEGTHENLANLPDHARLINAFIARN